MANQTGDIWACAIEFNDGQENGMITLHKQVDTVLDSDDDALGDALTGRLIALGQDYVDGVAGEGTTVVCATANRINIGRETRIYTAFSDGAASILDANLPAQDSILLSIYPAASDVIRSGRTFFPFVSTENQSEGQILSTVVTVVKAILDSISADELDLPAVATLKSIVWRKVGEIANEIVSSVLRPVIASQRRRVVHHQAFDPN